MTTQLDSIQESYNKYSSLSLVPYNMAKYLMDNDELIWKLLKYSSNDAWNKTNLTKSEKGALIYNGFGAITDKRMFFESSQNYAWTEAVTILRMAPVSLRPVNYVTGTQFIKFEAYTHESSSMLSNYQPRLLTIMQRLIEVFNGAEIDGIGRLFFDYTATNGAARLTGVNVGDATFRGYELIMGNKVLG